MGLDMKKNDGWIGNSFGDRLKVYPSKLFDKAVIVIVDSVHQIGNYGIPNVCSAHCNGKNLSCSSGELIEISNSPFRAGKNFRRNFVTDSGYMRNDNYKVDMDTMEIASFFHFMGEVANKEDQSSLENIKPKIISNTYRSKFFPDVVESLKKRGAEEFAALPKLSFQEDFNSYQFKSNIGTGVEALISAKNYML